MVRTKPELILTVPNVHDLETYSGADLITPPCYVVSSPPPLFTPGPSRLLSSLKTTSQQESDCELEDERKLSFRDDAPQWTTDQDELCLNKHPPHLNGPTSLLAPFDISCVTTQISRNVIRRHGWRGGRTVSSTHIRPLELTRENYTKWQGGRMDVDPPDSSLALSNSVRDRAHPYSRPTLPEFKLYGLRLASPFHEKHFSLPTSPSPKLIGDRGPSSHRHCSVRKCHC